MFHTLIYAAVVGTFNFRTVKDTETKVESKRPTVKVELKMLTVEDMVTILQSEDSSLSQAKAAILDAVNSAHLEFVKSIISEDASITSENVTEFQDKLSFESFANQPEAERVSRKISKEQFDEFLKHYQEVMPSLINVPLANVVTQAKMFQTKFSAIAAHANKASILDKCIVLLSKYINEAEGAERHAEVIESLFKRITSIKGKEELSLEDAFGL